MGSTVMVLGDILGSEFYSDPPTSLSSSRAECVRLWAPFTTPEETCQRGAITASNIPAHPSYRPKVRSAWSHTGPGQWSVREERQVLLLPTWPQPAGSTLGLAQSLRLGPTHLF